MKFKYGDKVKFDEDEFYGKGEGKIINYKATEMCGYNENVWDDITYLIKVTKGKAKGETIWFNEEDLK